MRLLALALAAWFVVACSAGDSSGDSSGSAHPDPGASTTTADDSLAAHTPTDLRNPCRVVSARAAGRVLGEEVTAREVTNRLAVRTLACRYAPEGGRDARPLEIRSAPDPTPLESLIRLYVGVDRLPHHPVDVVGADDAEVVVLPEEHLVTVFVKQGFVTHSVILGLDDVERGELLAVRLARLVVRGNQ